MTRRRLLRSDGRLSRYLAVVALAPLLAELLLVVPVSPVAAVTGQPDDSPPFKPVPTGVATEVMAAPIDLSSDAGADAGGVEVLADGTRIRPRDVKYTPPATDTEVVSARTENTSKTANTDGSFTVEASAGRLNFLDAQGTWQAIDLSLLPTSEDTFEVASNDREVTISTTDASEGLVEMRGGSAFLQMRVPGYGRATVSDGRSTEGGVVEPANGSDAPAEPAEPAEPAATAEPTVAPAASPEATVAPGATPTAFPSTSPAASPSPEASAQPSDSPAPVASPAPSPTPTPTPTPTPDVPVDPVVEPDAQPFPEGTVVVEGASGLDRITVKPVDTGFEFGAVLDSIEGRHTFTYVLDATGLIVSLDKDGRTILLLAPETSDGREVMVEVGRISAPTVIDGMYTTAPETAVSVATAALETGETELVYTFDEEWLKTAVYPVTLDPTACVVVGGSGCTVQGSTTGYIETYFGNDLPTSYPTTPSTLRMGDDNIGSPDAAWGILRTYLFFPSPSLFPSGTTASMVTSATLTMREDINRYGADRYLVARPMKSGWGNTSGWSAVASKVLSGYDSPNVLTCSTGGTDCNVVFDVTKATRAHYTRRGLDWKPNLGFELKMASEGSGFWETDFYPSTNGTLGNRPKLTITYEVPKVSIDFDAALGANYAPSSMTAGVPTKLPIILTNNQAGYAYDRCTSTSDTDCYQVGYRFFDAKGKVDPGNDGTADFTLNVPSAITTGSNPTATIPLAITPPAVPGTYTLRLDLVHRLGGSSGTYLWASDWAKPSAFNSRDKKILTTDNTRWTGSSSVERDEFSVTVGAGASGANVKSTTTGDGGSLGIDIATRNVHYTGAGGIGFSDLVSMGLSYGYDSKNATFDCPSGPPSKFVGMLDACGWYTNWDEHFTDTSSADNSGAYTYQDPSGARSFLNTDGQGQIAGAPVLIERPRVTYFDENGGGGTSATGQLVSAASESITAVSGASVLKVPSSTQVSLSGYVPLSVSINTYRLLTFSMRTTAATGTGIALKIHNATNSAEFPDAWLVYTVGTSWDPGFEYINLPGTVAGAWKTTTARNLYDDVRTKLPGDTYDQFELTGFQIMSKPSSTGSTYLDATFLSSGLTTIIAEPTFPTFSSNNTNASAYALDGAAGSANSLKVTPANLAGSPTCATPTCWSTSAGGLYAYPFVAWDWRKVGGDSVAIRFDLKNLRPDSGGPGVYATGSITYYAGPTPPSDAVNPVQVSATVPQAWAHVTRNLLADARQILSFYNDNPSGTSGTPPPNGPVGDDVRWVGYVVSAVDGNFALFDNLVYRSLPAASVVGSADFLATYSDRSVHAFNRDGLLTSIADRDGNTVSLDYAYNTAVANSARSYTLTTIHGPSDQGSYERQIDVTRPSGTVVFTERLGTTGSPITGRSTAFSVSAGDVTRIKPARQEGACAGSGPSGCVDLGYTSGTSHLLAVVADPRWDGSIDGPGEYRLTVGWSGSDPVTITDQSHNGGSGADLIRVLTWDRTTSVLGPRVLWQDSPSIAASHAIHSDLIADGRTLIDYVPRSCSPDCTASGNWPSDASGTIATTKRLANQFDGLSQVNQTTTYRTVSTDPVITRQRTRAGAKVDNYVNPLLGGQLAWSQTSDQLYASRVDSSNTNDDLYRTAYVFDDQGQLTHTLAPGDNALVNYPTAVLSATTAGTATASVDMWGYWRLDETSGTAADSDGVSSQVGTHTSVTQGATSAALTPVGANKAATYNGTSSRTTLASFGTVTGSFSTVVWVKPSTNASTQAFIGSRKGDTATTDYTFDAKLYYDGTTKTRAIQVDVGNGTAWLLSTFLVPYDWQAGRWVQIGVSVDDATDTVAVYADGQLVGSRPFTTAGTPRMADATRVMKIGNNGRDTITPQWFGGSIDEVALYKVALDRAQMAVLFAQARALTTVDQATTYDTEGHPTQTTDQFLANPGFEAGIARGWRTSGATFETTTVHTGGLGALKLAASGTAIQEVNLVPGQAFRFQGWNQVASGGTARYTLEYWKRSTAGWVAFTGMATNYTETSWASHAWDLPLPVDTDGRVRLTVSNTAGAGSVYFDDLALFTTFAAMTYRTDGLIDTTTTLSPAGLGTFVNHPVYASSAINPGIFATSVVVNDVASPTDLTVQDLTTQTTYDAWGRALGTTDPDGVTTTNTYKAAGTGNGALTDLVSVADGLGNATVSSFDLVGNVTAVQRPNGQTTATTYDALNHPLIVTAPDGTEARHSYDLVGQATQVIANYVDGAAGGATADDDVKTTYAHDEFGRITETHADVGGIDAVSAVTFDLLGNTLTSTVTPGSGGAGAARVTRSDFASANSLSRGAPTGVQLPVYPTAGGPDCDGLAGLCSSTSALDLNGRPISTRDAYDKATLTRYDLGGRVVQTITNYVDGTGGSGEVDSDLVTTTTYGLTGLVTSVTDPAARTTTTEYDAVGRPVKVTDASSARYTRAAYTAAGRIDRATDARTTDAALVWTKSVYDTAGRQRKTLGHYDASGNAGINAENFEDGDATGWASSGIFVTAGSALTAEVGIASPASGEGRLKVATGSGANAGTEWTLGGTFKSAHVYQAAAWVYAPAGTTINAYLGVAGDANLTAASIAGNGAWQKLSVTWTPTGDRTSVKLAYKRVSSGSSVNVYLDDVTVWDGSSAGTNPIGPDTNIPTETVYDASGRIVRSVVVGGNPGDVSLVTKTAYDAMDRVTSVTVNDVAGGGTAGAVNLTSSSAYDDLGRVTDATDATGTVTRYEYDRLGRTIATTANYVNGSSSGPTGDDDLTSTFAYNALGELTAYCPANAVVIDACDPTETTTTGDDYKSAWHYTYDLMGRMATQVPPVNEFATALDTSVWTYQEGGRLASVTDRTGDVLPVVGRHVDMTYDDVGRVEVSTVYAGSGTGSPKQTTTTTYNIDGSPTSTVWNGTADGLDTNSLAYTYTTQGWLNEIKDVTGSAVTLTDHGYNADGELTQRIDINRGGTGTAYTTDFTLDWAGRTKTVAAGSIYASTATFAYRFDGLIGSRTFPNGETLTFAYDTARRPTTITKANGNTFAQTYDRDSNVLSESRSLTGPTGDNGTNTNTFGYDALGRLTSETGLAAARTYQYDRDGNRTRKTEGGSTTVDFYYDRTDQLVKEKVNAGADTAFTYDVYGNLTQSANSAAVLTTYAYDTASHLREIQNTGTTQDATFTFDAIGRYRERTVNGVTDKYGYVGLSEATSTIVGATTRVSAITTDGSRVATKDGSTAAFLLPDLHGNVAATEQVGAVTIANAIRYDAYGQTMGSPYTGTGSVKLDTKYQGRLDISPSADPLYDMSARFYAPNLGTFTQLDTYAGSAQNPATMNRFLYALGNPASLIDPTGHAGCNPGKCATADGKVIVVDNDSNVTVYQGGQVVASSSSSSNNNSTKDDDSSPTTTLSTPTVSQLQMWWDGLTVEQQRQLGASPAQIMSTKAFGHSRLPSSIACMAGDMQSDLVCNVSAWIDDHSSIGGEAGVDYVGGPAIVIGPGAIMAEGALARSLAAAESARRAVAAEGAAAGAARSTSALYRFYPPNRGFMESPTPTVLKPGMRIDRYGREGGSFASPEGTPIDMRSLTPGSETAPYSVYEVVAEVEVGAGRTMPWFGKPGGGTQFEFNQSIADLVAAGILRRVQP